MMKKQGGMPRAHERKCNGKSIVTKVWEKAAAAALSAPHAASGCRLGDPVLLCAYGWAVYGVCQFQANAGQLLEDAVFQ